MAIQIFSCAHIDYASFSQQMSEAMSIPITESSTNRGGAASGSSREGSEDFIVVERQCAIEAMAHFIAETLMKCPQAAALPPAKLQEAILIAVQVNQWRRCYGL